MPMPRTLWSRALLALLAFLTLRDVESGLWLNGRHRHDRIHLQEAKATQANVARPSVAFTISGATGPSASRKASVRRPSSTATAGETIGLIANTYNIGS